MTRTRKAETHRRSGRGGGHLYVITNPAWVEYCKIGRTTNIQSRLRTYQTGSPYGDYQLFYCRYFSDACHAEKIFNRFAKGQQFEREWYQIHPQDAANLIDHIATLSVE